MPLVVLALLGIGMFLFFRRRRSRSGRADDEDDKDNEARAEADMRPKKYHELPPKAQDQPTYVDMTKNPPPQEIDSLAFNELPEYRRAAAEMEGTTPPRNSASHEDAIRDSQYRDRSFLHE